VITSGQERDYYDTLYAKFLALPDHAIRIDRAVFESNLENPSHPAYERRRLYRASMQALEAEPLEGKKVLDYGCGPADFGLWMAGEGAEVTLLDISPVAIEVGLKRAEASGLQVRGIAADASDLGMIPDAEFDVVFGCAALHHTLKYRGAVEELARVMKPGARLVLCETWGGSRLLNVARRIRSRLAHEVEEMGEEIILSRTVLKTLDPFFAEVRVEPCNLLAMGKRVFRGRFERSWVRGVLRALERADAAIFAVAPGLKDSCGEAVITARRRDL
jgi:2-polyprenyl-3-methyl-5-hydroxy-6-metoxy-1,4-benzoquinol methylase